MENELRGKDVLELLKQNRAWLGAPFLAVLTLGSAGAFRWPDTYRSSAVLRVTPPAASRSLVGDAFNVGMAERVREARRKLLESGSAAKGNQWKPVSPNRRLIAGASGVLGLLLGIALAWLRESNDEAIGSIRQLRQLKLAKILGGIPLLENDMVLRRRRRMAVVGWMSASFFSLASICAAALYHHYRQP